MNPYRDGWPESRAECAIVGDPMAAVIAAAKLRRAGIQVITYLAGSEKSQRKKAMADAECTLSVQSAVDLAS